MEDDTFKSPKGIIPYTTQRVDEDAPTTFYQIGALVFGVVSLLFNWNGPAGFHYSHFLDISQIWN